MEAWDRLGIRLVSSDTPASYPLGTFSFSIQHPDLTSALVAPRNAPTAEFQAVWCTLDISTSVTEYQTVETKPTDQPQQPQEKHINGSRETNDEIYHSLDLDDRMAIDSFLTPLGGPCGERSREINLKRKRVKSVKPVADVSASRSLVEATMDILLFGGGKKCFGFKVLEGEALPGLMHLAPGVFHMPYLKVSTSDYEIIPAY